VEHRLALDQFAALEDVGMAAQDRVGPGGNRRAGDIALVIGDFRADEMDAPVLRDDDDVGLRLGGADVRLHRGQVLAVRERCGSAPGCRAGRARSARRRVCARIGAQPGRRSSAQ
jgi:hypothetical protein